MDREQFPNPLLAHAALFLVIATVPLLLAGLDAWLAGAAAILAGGLTLALLDPWLPERRWLARATLSIGGALAAGGGALLRGTTSTQAGAWALAGLLILLWLAVLYDGTGARQRMENGTD